ARRTLAQAITTVIDYEYGESQAAEGTNGIEAVGDVSGVAMKEQQHAARFVSADEPSVQPQSVVRCEPHVLVWHRIGRGRRRVIADRKVHLTRLSQVEHRHDPRVGHRQVGAELENRTHYI